jgi:hypothetical protein
MRGNVLNSAGVYNRCKLTRLVIDTEWDKNVWNDSWQVEKDVLALQTRLADKNLLGEEFETSTTKRRKSAVSGQSKKRLKRDNDEGAVWGVDAVQEDVAKEEFLSSNVEVVAGRKMKQSRITPMRGMELEARRVLCGLAELVVTRSSFLEELRESVPVRLLGVREWEEWEPDVMCETKVVESEPKVCKLCAKSDKQTDGMSVCSHYQNRNTKSISLTSGVEHEYEPQAFNVNSIKRYFNTISQSGNDQSQQKTTSNSSKKFNKLGCDNSYICATPPRRKFGLFPDQDVKTVRYGGGDSDLVSWTGSQGGGEKRLCREGESERS